MGPEPAIPTELWLKVFNEVPREALPALSLTNQHFHLLARSLLFSYFRFRPYASSNRGETLLPPADELEKWVEKLNFWCSDEIAPLVRECVIQPSEAEAQYLPTDTPAIILDVFFDNINRFTSLNGLVAFLVPLSLTARTKISCMSSLRRLEITGCAIVGADTGLFCPLLSLSKFRISQIAPEREDGLIPWLPLLSPNYLRKLDLLCNLGHLLNDFRDFPEFPLVEALSIQVLQSKVDLYLPILLKFPSVRVLNVVLQRLWGRPAPWHVNWAQTFPVLTQLTTSDEVIPLFGLRQTLTHLTVYLCTPSALIPCLTASNSIVSLDLQLKNLTNSELASITQLFPRLAELSIQVFQEFDDEMFDEEGRNYVASRTFKALPTLSSISPAMRCLAIRWWFYSEGPDHSSIAMHEPLNLVELRDALSKQFPALSSLWLDSDTFLLRWRKFSDKTVKELNVGGMPGQGSVDARMRMDDVFRAWWETR